MIILNRIFFFFLILDFNFKNLNSRIISMITALIRDNGKDTGHKFSSRAYLLAVLFLIVIKIKKPNQL